MVGPFIFSFEESSGSWLSNAPEIPSWVVNGIAAGDSFTTVLFTKSSVTVWGPGTSWYSYIPFWYPKMRAQMSYTEVAEIIERFVNGTGGPLEWDGYTMGMKFEDPFLRSTQDRCRALWVEFPPTEKSQYTSAEGFAGAQRTHKRTAIPRRLRSVSTAARSIRARCWAAYVSNNPLNYTDPSGLGFRSDLGGNGGTRPLQVRRNTQNLYMVPECGEIRNPSPNSRHLA